MKKRLNLFLFTCLFSTLAVAQSNQLDSTSYDFWVGKWDAKWENANGTTGSGPNHVIKVLDGTILSTSLHNSPDKSHRHSRRILRLNHQAY